MWLLPTPTTANLFVYLHQQKEILTKLLPNLYFYRKCSDDGCIIWKHNKYCSADKHNYKAFKRAVNSGGLRSTFTDPAQKVQFMDLTVNT